MPSDDKMNDEIKNTQVARTLEFFQEIDKDGKIYKCTECGKIYKGNNLSNLTSHFKTIHKDIFYEKIASKYENHILIQREKIVHSCVELTLINSHPFSLLSQSGYRNLIEDKLNAFKLAGCPLNLSDHHVYEIKKKVNDTAKKIREQIKLETRGRIISVMVDSATRNGRSIYGVSIQYKHNGVLRVFAVGMRELNQSHTAEHLAKELLKILAEYDINLDQVISITTDNGTNMLAMVKEVDRKLRYESRDETNQNERDNIAASIVEPIQNIHLMLEDENYIDCDIEKILTEVTISDDDALDMLFDDSDIHESLLENIVADLRNKTGNQSLFVNSVKCAAHTIQLAVNDALKMLPKHDQNVIDLCRLTAKYMRLQSTKNAMQQAELKSILPGLDCKTRWSSTYLMVRVDRSLN